MPLVAMPLIAPLTLPLSLALSLKGRGDYATLLREAGAVDSFFFASLCSPRRGQFIVNSYTSMPLVAIHLIAPLTLPLSPGEGNLFTFCPVFMYNIVMRKFDIFNQFRDAVLIVNKKCDVVYKNYTFKRWFKSFVDLKKFSHNTNFNICPLNSENLENYSPIWHALNSKENFFACVSYQSASGKIYYYDLTVLKKGKYSVMFFTDVSATNLLETERKKNERIKNEFEKLKEENEDLLNIKQKAQSQAIRIALINKVSNTIRESMDISKILQSALTELASMFGAYKAYYASVSGNKFKVEEIYGNKSSMLDKLISFDSHTFNIIADRKISVVHCLKEYMEAEPFKQPIMRIIVPVFHLQKPVGVIVLLSYQKRELNEELEILEAISLQLGNAIIRAELYQKNIRTVKELKNTLKELKETQIQLINSEKMASLGQLIAGVAHEINTPVASIKSNNGLLSKLIPQIKDAEIADIMQEINQIDSEAIDRISNMVLSLKKFVRLDEAELQEADINKELDLTLDLIRHETKNRIEIVKQYGNLPLIKCYPNMLNQVFTNILINACQAIEGNGTIIITTGYEGETLTVSIKDSGKGIPEEEISKIFAAGYTTKGVGIGTGLGLAICNKIIEKHKGKIIVNSEVGKGSEFIITINSK